MKIKNISIKYKISFIIIATVLLFALANMAITRSIVRPRYLQIEDEDAKKTALRVQDMMRNELRTLDDLSRDWAAWDDSYNFIKDMNEEYKVSNLTDESLKSSKLNFIAFLNTKGDLIDSKGLNYHSMRRIEFSYFKEERFKKDMIFLNMLNNKSPVPRKKVSEIINTIMGPLIISARPVTDSAMVKEPDGVLILGRLFDNIRISELKSETDIDFDIFTDQTTIRFKLKGLIQFKDYNQPILFKKNRDTIVYAVQIPDISRSTAVLALVNYKRSLYNTLVSAQNYSFAILMIFISIFTIFSIYLIQTIVISPILNIADQLSKIMNTNNLESFKILKRNDELGFMSYIIKRLLFTIIAQQKVLSEKAYRDGLTNILNRRSLDERLSLEFSRLQRSGLPLSIIMCDIDFFKKFNDHFGHQAGDRCLISIANALSSCAGRPGDLVARYGGEEFIVVLPESDLKAALNVAKRIKKAVADLKIHHPLSKVSKYVTISMGIASTANTSLNQHETMIKAADAALYKAKESGRNRIETITIKKRKRQKKR